MPMMLQSGTDLDFLAAALHGRRSRLAEAERLDALCRIRSVPELARALFPDAALYTAVDLQRRLVMDQVAELSEVAGHLGGAAARLLEWLRVRFQVENLKVLARGFAAGMRPADLQPHLVLLPRDLAVDAEAIASAGSIEAFAALIRPEPLREGVRQAFEVYHRQPRPFFVEAGLDHGYLGELLRRAGALPRADRANVLTIARQEADMFHLALAARGKFFYEVEAEVLMLFHVKGAGISREMFAAMARADDLAGAAQVAVARAIDALPPGLDSHDRPQAGTGPSALEVLAWSRFHRLANRTFRLSHMGLGAVVAYAAIRRVELANLITLSEGIRMRLPPEAIRRRLIPPST